MASSYRSNALVVALALATASQVNAATEQKMVAQSLSATPVASLAARLGLDNRSGLVEKASQPTAHGTRTVRMQQTYMGVPVYGKTIAVEQDNRGNALRATGVVATSLNVELASVTPKLDPAAAVDVLQRRNALIAAPGAKAENTRADLYVYPQDNAPARLVYLTSYVLNGDHPSRPTAIIDANTGEVIAQWEGLTNAEMDATGPGGNTKTGQYTYGTDYPALRVTQSGSTCTAQNANVKTYNLNHRTSGGTLWSFTCPTSQGDAINGAYSPINDAHHFGGVVHDMYVAYTGAAPLNQVLLMKVHYGNSYENAFWDGTQMSFGDGASTFYPLVAIDVTGHEISHGYTEQHSNLAYTGQSGGMNEAYSDIAGEATEFFDRGSNDFLVGSDIVKTSAGIGDALRYMCNPPQDGGSIDNAADYKSGLDVHYSSGVYNKAFCLLAKTSGWDTEKAFKVFARANALYWGANETFNDGACGVASAATDLGFSSASVATAFTGVGVICGSNGEGGGSALSNGVAKTGISGAKGSETNYTVVIAAGARNLTIAMSGGTGDADLYTRFGSVPTTTTYDCRPYKTGNAETCTVAAPKAGTYYVKIRGYAAYSGVSIKASWAP